MDVSNLLLVMLLAVLAPLLADAVPRLIVPVAVVEVLLGIVAGPQVLGIMHVDRAVSGFSEFGLGFLFFLAGMEIDLGRIRGRPLRTATTAWLIGLVAAVGVAAALYAAGLPASPMYLGLALATTALGTLLPALADARQVETRLGRAVMACGAVGEFLPIVGIALVLEPRHQHLRTVLLLNLFVVIILAGVVLARRFRPPRLSRLVHETMHSTGQLAIRLSVLLLLALMALAFAFGLDVLLGAFAAGAIVAQVIGTSEAGDVDNLRALRAKYEGIGFGIVIPVYFLATGARFDLRALLSGPLPVLLMLGFLVLFVVLRGLPSALLARRAGMVARRVPLMLLTATALPLVVTITGLGTGSGNMSGTVASSLVGAAMLSVLVFPSVALGLVRRGSGPARS